MEKTVNSRNYGLILFKPAIGSLSGPTTPGQSGPRSDGNDRVLNIPQSSSITATSSSDSSVSYTGHSLAGGGSYPFAEKQPVYSTAPADWATDCPEYHTKPSEGEAPVMLDFGGMQSTHLLPLLSSPLWPGVVASDRVLSIGQIELNCVLCKTELFEIELFWHLSCVLMLSWTVLSFKCVNKWLMFDWIVRDP